MLCAKCGTIVMADNNLARAGATYKTPYTYRVFLYACLLAIFIERPVIEVRTKCVVFNVVELLNKISK